MIQQQFMQRALELAQQGLGAVSPNPMVGCVIVYESKIIGEGWHKKYGEAHAEVNAINSVQDKSLLSKSDVYVTLEPCSHFGKTPPCADLLIKSKVKRVIVCNTDSNPLVAGKGIQKLRDVGIEVITGVLEAEGRALNKRFFTFIEKQRPYITLKWAESLDGYISLPNFQAVQISNALSKRYVHKMRAEEDAILVGKRTTQYDNPRLNVREWAGRNPVRVLVDRNLSLPRTLNVFDNSQTTICYNQQEDKIEHNNIFVKIPDNDNLEAILLDLKSRNIQSIIVEGGSALLQSFINENLWDEALIFKSNSAMKEGIAAPKLRDAAVLIKTETLSDNQLFIYKND